MINNLLGMLVPYPLHIEQVRSIPHPQFAYKWVALLPNLIKFSFPLEIQSPPSFPVPIVEEAEVPFMSSSVYTITEGAQPYSIADKHSLGNNNQVSFALYVDQYGITISYINAWKSLVRNPDRTFNYPVEYKYDILVFLVATIGFPYVGFKLKGAFPLSTSFERLNYSGRSERVVLSQEFSVDDIEIYNPTDYVKSESVRIISRVFDVKKPEHVPASSLP